MNETLSEGTSVGSVAREGLRSQRPRPLLPDATPSYHVGRVPLEIKWGKFWSRVKKTDSQSDCWVWTGGLYPHGYGRFYWYGYEVRSHRLVWFYHTGEDPGVLDVLHKCDNPPCCNFHHLFLGTPLVNALDARAKGRASKPPLHFGIHQHNHKINDDVVREIRRLRMGGLTMSRIALATNSSKRIVSSVISGESWKHVK